MENDVKRIINVNTSLWNRFIYGKITIKQAFILLLMIILTILLTTIFIVFINIVAGIFICLIMISLTIIFSIKNSFVINIFWAFLKYIFSKKIIKNKIDNFHNGELIIKNKKIMFFEINAPGMIGERELVMMQINDIINQISRLKNWSIINTTLPYVELDKNKEYIDQLIKDYVQNKKLESNDVILRNLLMNQYLTNKYVNGSFQKNTYLLAIDTTNSSIQNILNIVKDINKNLNYINFSLSILNNKIFNFVNNNFFLSNQKIKINRNHIKVIDKKSNKYYQFIKITDLPNFVDIGYLDFLNSIELDQCDLSFCINTYSIKNQKKEDKLWESAVKFTEAEFNRAKKNKEIIEAENNIKAINEITNELVSNNSITQKYNIIVCIKSNSLKKLNIGTRRVKDLIRKNNQMKISFTSFKQKEFYNEFNRNLFVNKKILTTNILPNNLIMFSYPFIQGNDFSKNGLFMGEMFSGAPIFKSLNSGEKTNNSTLIVGKTGSGKTTFINTLIKNNMSEQNVKTLLLDPKGEYVMSDDIKNMKPHIINMDNDEELVLNPFELSLSDKNPADKVNFVLEYLKIWFGIDFNISIQNKLLNALEECVLENWNIDAVYSTLKSKLKSTQEDLIILDTIKRITTKGIYNYFAKPCKYNLKGNLIIFNLSAILNNMSSLNKVKLLLIFKFLKLYIYKQENLKSDNKNKIQIIVDEFPAIANPAVPFVVTEFVSFIRLIRSYDASLILTLQDMTRFESTDIGSNESLKSIANNVAHKFILNMNSEQLNILKKIWGDESQFSKEEEQEITMKFSPGDVLYISNVNRIYMNSTYPLSPYSNFDKQEIESYINKFISEINSCQQH